ncbi:MAG: hypothetical protein KAH32_01490 [Chlamydiia bacterium]|nr:hypothetical protein [Chlamydiia bacterium]
MNYLCYVRYITCIFLCFSASNANDALVILDARDQKSSWGIEHKIGVSMLNDKDAVSALIAFKRSSILMDYAKYSFPDIMNKYYQMVCRFFTGNFSEVESLGNYIRDANDFCNLYKLRPMWYKDILVMMYFSYECFNLPAKTSAMLQEIGEISPITASKIEEISEIKSLTNIEIISALKRSGNSTCIRMSNALDHVTANFMLKTIFPEYLYYLVDNKLASVGVLIADLVILPIAYSNINSLGKRQLLAVTLAIRCFASARACVYMLNKAQILKEQSIDCLMNIKEIKSSQLLSIAWSIK